MDRQCSIRIVRVLRLRPETRQNAFELDSVL